MITINIRFETADLREVTAVSTFLDITMPYIVHDLTMFDVKDNVGVNEYHVMLESVNDLAECIDEVELLLENTIPFMVEGATIEVIVG